MADEHSRLRGTPSAIPKGKDWPSLLAKDGDELEVYYCHTLEELGKCSGMLGIMLAPASPTGLPQCIRTACLRCAPAPQGAEQEPGLGQAVAVDRGPDRQGAVVEPSRRC